MIDNIITAFLGNYNKIRSLFLQMKFQGYTEGRNFQKAISRAIESCETSDINSVYHFVEVNKMITVGKIVKRKSDRKMQIILFFFCVRML